MRPKQTQGQLLQHMHVAGLLWKHWDGVVGGWTEDILLPLCPGATFFGLYYNHSHLDLISKIFFNLVNSMILCDSVTPASTTCCSRWSLPDHH